MFSCDCKTLLTPAGISSDANRTLDCQRCQHASPRHDMILHHMSQLAWERVFQVDAYTMEPLPLW